MNFSQIGKYDPEYGLGVVRVGYRDEDGHFVPVYEASTHVGEELKMQLNHKKATLAESLFDEPMMISLSIESVSDEGEVPGP